MLIFLKFASFNFHFLFLFLVIFTSSICLSLKIESIPPQGSPPMNLFLTSSVYDPSTSSIYIIGGYSQEKQHDISDIYSYNLLTNKWSHIIPESDFVPYGLDQHYAYLGQNRVIYIFFGISQDRCISDVFTYDLQSNTWDKTKIAGDYITGRTGYSITSFTWNSIDYIAVYGGFDNFNYDSNLYL